MGLMIKWAIRFVGGPFAISDGLSLSRLELYIIFEDFVYILYSYHLKNIYKIVI